MGPFSLALTGLYCLRLCYRSWEDVCWVLQGSKVPFTSGTLFCLSREGSPVVWHVLGAQTTIPSQGPSQSCLQRKMKQGAGIRHQTKSHLLSFSPFPSRAPCCCPSDKGCPVAPQAPGPSTLQALSTLQKTRWNQAEPLLSAKTLPFMPRPDRPDNGGSTTTLIMRPQGLEDNWRRGRDRARLAAGF